MSSKKRSGLDIDLGNSCSKIAYSWAKKTFAFRAGKIGTPAQGLDGAFSNVMNFNGARIGISSDGIGTKIEIAERTAIYNTLGFDLLAMVADDLVCNGLEPVSISNILDVDFLNAEIVDQLMQGLHDAAQFSGVIITGGEIAELGSRIGGYGDRMHFNWCSTGIGLVSEGVDVIDGHDIQAGDVVIALKSRGFRSNGFSLIRKVMEDQFGPEWHTEQYDEKQTWGEIILTPSLIYTPLVVKLIAGKFKLKGVAHITGGGIADNLSRILEQNGLGADLDDIFPVLPVMIRMQSLGAIDEKTAYRIWNMGNGMMLIASRDQAEDLLSVIAGSGYQAKLCGKITAQSEITIQSHGAHPGKLRYTY